MRDIARGIHKAHLAKRQIGFGTVYNLRTYPVSLPSFHPEGYWEMLGNAGPSSLIQSEKLKTEAHWIAAGHRALDDVSTQKLTSFDPQLIAQAKSGEFM
jgi:hypothetical protein